MSQFNEESNLRQDRQSYSRRQSRQRNYQSLQREEERVISSDHIDNDQKVTHQEQPSQLTKITIPWNKHLSILFFSLILSLFSVSVPLFRDFANGLQSQNLYTGMMFAKGELPYSDFFATGGFFYYFLISLAYRLGSTLWLIPIQFITYYLSGIYLYKTVKYLTTRHDVAFCISLIFYVINGTLGFGGLYPVQFAMPFILGAIWFLTRYFAGHSRDEAFVLYGFAGTAGALLEPRSLIFWIVSLLTIFIYNAVNKHFARGFYQVLCIIFGNILILYTALYFILNLQITSNYINQALSYNFTQLAVESHNLLLTLPLQVVVLLGSGLLIGAITVSGHLFGEARDKSIKWGLLISFVITAVYVLFAQTYSLYIALTLVPYGLILTALYLGDLMSRRTKGSHHRRKNETPLKVLGYFISRNLFLPLIVFALAFSGPFIVYIYNLSNNTERSEVANYIRQNSKDEDTIYIYDSTAKIYLDSQRKATTPFVVPSLNTATATNKRTIEDTLLQNSATFIVVHRDTSLPSALSTTLSNHYEKITVKGVENFTIYRLK